jgi:O-antigen/teichoic acid export membrane protein
MNKKLKELEKISIYVLQSGISGLLTILLFPIITSKLGPEIYGIYALSIVYASIFIGIANFGCIAGYERNFFLYESSKEKSARLLNSVQMFVCSIFIVVIIIGWLTQNYVSNLLLRAPNYSELWWIVLCGAGLSSLAQYYLAYLKNSGLAKIYFQMTIAQVVVNFILIYFGLNYTDYGVIVLAYAHLISNILLCFFLFLHQYKSLRINYELDLLIEVLKISIPLTPKVLFGFLNTQFDKIMLGAISSVGSVGVYVVAQRIALFVFTFMTSLDHVFKPAAYRMLFTDEGINVVGKYLVPYMYISIAPALIIILFSSEILNLLVTDLYLSGVSVLVILCLYYSMMFFGKISGMQLIYAKKTWLTSKLMLCGILLNVLLNIPMIMNWGANGAALATTCSSFIMLLIYNYFAQKHARIYWKLDSIIMMYTLLLFSALYVLLIQFDVIIFNYYFQLIGKAIIIFMFICMGVYIRVINKENLLIIRNFLCSR